MVRNQRFSIRYYSQCVYNPTPKRQHSAQVSPFDLLLSSRRVQGKTPILHRKHGIVGVHASPTFCEQVRIVRTVRIVRIVQIVQYVLVQILYFTVGNLLLVASCKLQLYRSTDKWILWRAWIVEGDRQQSYPEIDTRLRTTQGLSLLENHLKRYR